MLLQQDAEIQCIYIDKTDVYYLIYTICSTFCHGMCQYGVLAHFSPAAKFCEVSLRHSASVLVLHMHAITFLFPEKLLTICIVFAVKEMGLHVQS